MRGSVALWYQRSSKVDDTAASPVPTVELHFNLWRDLKSSANFFDVGLLLTNVPALRRIFLFVPGPIALPQIADLSRLLLQGDTLNAVFNDVIEVQEREEDSFTTLKDGALFLRIHHVNPASDLSVEIEEFSDDLLGTVINFNEQLCRRLNTRNQEKHYIRIRISFDHRTADLFSSEIDPQDRWLLSSFSRIELTEFRLNERRSLPTKIAKRADGHGLLIERVHYFLVRDFRHELILQHADFRKVRRLEADLWRHYLRGRLPGDEVNPDLLPQRAGEQMVIYHWREDEKLKNGKVMPIEDFIAFASFRSPTPNIFFYAAVIVVLGALGASVAAAVSDELTRIISAGGLPWIGSSASALTARVVGLIANSGTFVIFGLVLLGMAIFDRLRVRKRRGSKTARPPAS